jgi:hypothetical protein
MNIKEIPHLISNELNRISESSQEVQRVRQKIKLPDHEHVEELERRDSYKNDFDTRIRIVIYNKFGQITIL